MTRSPPLVRLEHVDVAIEGTPVLRDIDLAIVRGRHFGIVGANGSGKSTLLALIAGHRWPAPGRGHRTYDFGDGAERDAVTARARITLIGHELQDLYTARGWNFRVRDVVLSGLTRSDIPKRNRSEAEIREADALLERFGLIDLADRRILELSRGQQRRVLIARALAFKPDLLLLDEPLSGLDAASRPALLTLLAAAAQLTTLGISVHHRDELPEFVAECLTVDAGRLIRGETAAADLSAAMRAGGTAATPAKSIAAERASGRDSNAVIVLESVSVWLLGRAILRDVDWSLRRHEHWLITGPNGAGKSTLLRVLHGDIRPARGGRIRWPGLGNPRNVWRLRQQIALVSAELQARYRYPTTVYDAVASGFTASIGRTRNPSESEHERIEELLTQFELGSLRSRMLSSLSYGQRHRTLIARTLAVQPQVVLLDEPWEGLDAHSAAIVRVGLGHAVDAGAQIVCVSHVGARGLPLNRQLELAQGRIIDADGSA